MRSLISSVAPLLALLLAPGSLNGQALPTQLQRLPLDTEVRLELIGGTFLRGRITRHDPVSLTLRHISRPSAQRAFLEHRIVGLDSIARGWSYDGNHWKVGTALGAGLGALLVFVAGEITLSTQDGATCNVGCWLLAEGAGAAVGAGLGFAIGRAAPRWRILGAVQ